MAANPQLVKTNIPPGTFTYDGVPNQMILRGTVIDVPAGSALATALGANITPLTAQQLGPNGADGLGAGGTLSSQGAGGGGEPYTALEYTGGQ